MASILGYQAEKIEDLISVSLEVIYDMPSTQVGMSCQKFRLPLPHLPSALPQYSMEACVSLSCNCGILVSAGKTIY